jgi:hypothetical protein
MDLNDSRNIVDKNLGKRYLFTYHTSSSEVSISEAPPGSRSITSGLLWLSLFPLDSGFSSSSSLFSLEVSHSISDASSVSPSSSSSEDSFLLFSASKSPSSGDSSSLSSSESPSELSSPSSIAFLSVNSFTACWKGAISNYYL